MASYQIPQFLDSGEKILGPMNLRQFGYALGGFMLCAAIFTFLNTLIPGIGLYALFFIVPVALLAVYLALGKYNGRDSEVYVYKLLLFMLKPKNMVYQRQPYVDDLNKKMAEWSVDNISKRWARGFAKDKDLQKNEQNQYGKKGIKNKAQIIQFLGDNIDTSTTNALSKVKENELKNNLREVQLNKILELKKQQKLTKKKNKKFF
jgi:PrgI family protein